MTAGIVTWTELQEMTLDDVVDLSIVIEAENDAKERWRKAHQKNP